MRLGFVDCASNLLDPLDVFSQMAEQKMPGVSFDRLTAPDLLKVPLNAKKLLSSGADAAVVFLMPSEEDWAAVSLVHEKVIDVELATEKYVFFCIVSQDEFSTNEQLEQLVASRFDTLLSLISNTLNSPGEVSKAIGDQTMADAFSALAGLGGAAMAASDQGEAESTFGSGPEAKKEDDEHSLF